MISIIICSQKAVITEEVRANITETIGCEFELVDAGHSGGECNIFETCNKGVACAKGEILCFMHDGVRFKSSDWGNVIRGHFHEDEQIGLIGLAGTHFLPDTPMCWCSSPFVARRFGESEIVEAVAVDGFCFFVRKSLFDQIAFDEKTYKGSRLYDMDICMQVIEAGLKVCVCGDVQVEHGRMDNKQYSEQEGESLLTDQRLFVEKWKKDLPIWRGLDAVPDHSFMRVNGLYGQMQEAKRLRHTWAYRLGKVLLSPMNLFKSVFAPKNNTGER